MGSIGGSGGGSSGSSGKTTGGGFGVNSSWKRGWSLGLGGGACGLDLCRSIGISISSLCGEKSLERLLGEKSLLSLDISDPRPIS